MDTVVTCVVSSKLDPELILVKNFKVSDDGDEKYFITAVWKATQAWAEKQESPPLLLIPHSLQCLPPSVYTWENGVWTPI